LPIRMASGMIIGNARPMSPRLRFGGALPVPSQLRPVVPLESSDLALPQPQLRPSQDVRDENTYRGEMDSVPHG
jgi:hypothetical protein